MGTVLSLFIVSVTSASTLWIGAITGAYKKPPDRLIGILIGFASGALITALAFNLFEGAVKEGGTLPASIGLLVGTVAFVVVDYFIDHLAEESSGLGLLASVTLDGIPENLALGVGLIGASVSEILALLVAIAAGNLPESLGSAASMREDDQSPGLIILIWGVTGVTLGVVVFGGYALLQGAGDRTLGLVKALAAGAVLASLANELMPQAYKQVDEFVAIATAAGFLVTFLLIP